MEKNEGVVSIAVLLQGSVFRECMYAFDWCTHFSSQHS